MIQIQDMVSIRVIAQELYFRLPFWKRWQFRKWYKSNNWDVKGIYTRCLLEAKYMVDTEEKFRFSQDN